MKGLILLLAKYILSKFCSLILILFIYSFLYLENNDLIAYMIIVENYISGIKVMQIDKNTLPLLVLRDIVVFPGTIAPIFVGRKKSIEALVSSKNYGDGNHILIVTQKRQEISDPGSNDIYYTGVLAKVIQTVKLPGDNAKILIEAINRVRIQTITEDDKLIASYDIIPDDEIRDLEKIAHNIELSIESFKIYAKHHRNVNIEVMSALSEQKNPSIITNILASHLNCDLHTKQRLLEETDIYKRAETICDLISQETTSIDAEQAVQERVKQQIERTQRDYYLNEKMKAIQQELGSNGGSDKSEFYELEEKLKKLKLSKDAKAKAESELKKLRMMNQMSAESSVIRNYLEVLLALPWGKKDNTNIEINKTQKILDRDHYGLEKVKDRIIEYLSVLKRSKKIKGPIICLIGAPGVGKTSLVKSIAEAVGRKYCKFSLGGVRDEAEIRGHRKTYLGSMPGKIISLIKKSNTDNPVMLLDEIDKMSSDYRGDPSSALLEVLDPEQNSQFSDHYLEVEYDLSDVMFIATSNSYDIPRPLLDRMEIINIAGYVEDEKLQIAKNHLLKKQLKMHNMKDGELEISDNILLEIIRYYTKEAGVRNLEREIGTLCRKVLTQILKDGKIKKIVITHNNLEEYLGVRKYKFGLAEKENQVGATTGLAYTQVGGDLLSLEAVALKGKGGIKATGKLGDIMKESAEAAYSCFLSKAKSLKVSETQYKGIDIHLHVPEGAIPKDGPSAGIAIYTTIASLMTNKPVDKTVAMTGEITLRGRVLPIGGLKEKLLAASRGGIKIVIIPEDNVKDLKDIPESIKKTLKIMPVSNVEQVLDIALCAK